MGVGLMSHHFRVPKFGGKGGKGLNINYGKGEDRGDRGWFTKFGHAHMGNHDTWMFGKGDPVRFVFWWHEISQPWSKCSSDAKNFNRSSIHGQHFFYITAFQHSIQPIVGRFERTHSLLTYFQHKTKQRKQHISASQKNPTVAEKMQLTHHPPFPVRTRIAAINLRRERGKGRISKRHPQCSHCNYNRKRGGRRGNSAKKNHPVAPTYRYFPSCFFLFSARGEEEPLWELGRCGRISQFLLEHPSFTESLK